ncbi:hypothetical protein [Streptomyces tibetensis]|uniref:hypothetical protein n=1 Tax=Streptomyces tibetensis TaxID=2382123 RepID=UPI0033E4E151
MSQGVRLPLRLGHGPYALAEWSGRAWRPFSSPRDLEEEPCRVVRPASSMSKVRTHLA